MTELPPIEKLDQDENDAMTGRRRFLQGVASATVLGALGTAASQSVQGQQRGPVEDPKTPPGLKRPAMLSSKYTVCYEKSVPAAMAVMTNYFSALSRRDLRGIASALNFPHGTYEGTEAVVLGSAEELMDKPPQSMNVSGKGDHLIQSGAYDVLDSLNLHIYNPVRVALSMTYSRYEPSGHKILECQGVYWVTDNDGKWGIEMASTIFTPADQIGVQYEDGKQAFLRWERDSWLQYILNDRTAVINPNGPYRQFGKQISLPVTTGPDLFDAREGDPMMRYRIKGVKSRMVVADVPLNPPTPFRSDPSPISNNYPDGSLYNGGGEAVGQYRASMVLPGAQVLHAGINKTHALTGLVRYTDKWERILELRYINIYTYKRGRWGMAGGGDPDHYLDYSDHTDKVGS